MIGLTGKQKRILEFIRNFSRAQGMPPTVYEIADRFGIKTSTVHAHLLALQSKGALTRSSKARSIKVNVRMFPAQPKGQMLVIPLLGRISAGLPLAAEEQREGEIYFSPNMLRGNIVVNRMFALKVNGDSMRDLGILDGDVIVVQQTQSLREGDIVVALVEGDETTVKSYYRTPDGMIELRPANPDYQSRFFPLGEVLVQGKVLGLQRSY